MKRVRSLYQDWPSWLKIIILNGGIQTLLLAQSWLSGEVANWQMYGFIWVGCIMNILIHLKLNEEQK